MTKHFALLILFFSLIASPLTAQDAVPDAERLITPADIESVTGITVLPEDKLPAADAVRYDSADGGFAFNLFFMPEGFEYEASGVGQTVDGLGDAADFVGGNAVMPVNFLTIKRGDRVIVLEATNLKGSSRPLLTLDQMTALAKIALGRL